MPEEEVKKVDELVDKLEQEIAKINSAQENKTEWHLAELAIQSQETVMNFSTKIMGDSEEDKSPDREAIKNLSSSLREATILFKKAEERMNKKEEPPTEPAEETKPAEPVADPNLTKEIEDLKAQLDGLKKENESLKSLADSITSEELDKMDKLADTINTEVSEVTLMTSEADANSEMSYDWILVDQVLEAMKHVNECFDKVIPDENNAKLAVRKLRERMYMATTTIKKSIIVIQQKVQQAMALAGKNEDQSESMNKLKEELQKLGEEISEKTEQLAKNETELAQLTDTVDQAQKKEGELRKRLQEFEELEIQHESKVNDMYQQLKAKDDRIQEAEDAKDKAEKELNEALEQLEKADECLKMLEQQAADLGPLQ